MKHQRMSLRIYTRTGDAGDTGLFGGERVGKDDLYVESYGTVDELNAVLGQVRTHAPDAELDAVLLQLQYELFVLGSDLATPEQEERSKGRIQITRVTGEQVVGLEKLIDRFEAELPPLRNFILPGGDPLAAAMHVARVVCRRAERRCVALAKHAGDGGTHSINPEIIRYLNRLSDLLFVLSRAANQRKGVADILWETPSAPR